MHKKPTISSRSNLRQNNSATKGLTRIQFVTSEKWTASLKVAGTYTPILGAFSVIYFLVFVKLCSCRYLKPVKRFQMKSNGCRDVQHTGLQSTQTRRNTGKQGAQTRGTRSAHLPKHPYISGSTACLTTKQFFPQFFVTSN